jgi:hypothetical protein
VAQDAADPAVAQGETGAGEVLGEGAHPGGEG